MREYMAGVLRQTVPRQNLFVGGLPMNCVGIDIAKHKHDCFIITELGEVLNEGFSFENNAKGFSALLDELKKSGRETIRIGFESTGNYSINLKLFLEKNGYSFMEINPVLVKEHIKSQSLRRTTTDKLSVHESVFAPFNILLPHFFPQTADEIQKRPYAPTQPVSRCAHKRLGLRFP
jgi:hypothetical protein